MPRQAAASIQNNFSKGLITEATGLNFPENAVTDTDNCVFDERGRVRRRFGIDFETDYETQLANRTDAVVNSFYWKAAAGNGDNALVVLQVGATLYFYLLGDGALSDEMIDTITLTDFDAPGAPSPATVECQFASGNGYLFVSHPTLEPFYVAYDPDTDTVTGTAIEVKIRDFEGVEDDLEIDERPLTLSAEHEYNLRNQGWFVSDFPISGADTAPVGDLIDDFFLEKSTYPSNADIWPLFVVVPADGIPSEIFNPARGGYDRGNTPAPKGHYILNAFYQDRSDASGVVGLDVVSSGFARPSSIAFFAGRVWYAGAAGRRFSNRIYFSQIVERDSQFGECFQANDPTDRETFDLLPTDGGNINIQEAGTIVKLWPIEDSLLVFATNGIWSVTGSEGVGFRANDYSVRKLSSVPALTSSSFVDVAGVPSWWNSEGIYIATPSQLGGTTIQSLTDQSIRTLYEDIPANNKRFAKGYFNTRTRVVHWVYRTTTYASLTEAYSYDGILNFNTLSTAFYPWTVDNSPVSINGVIVVEGQGSVTQLQTVTNSALATVTNAALANVEVLVDTSIAFSAVTKFISSYSDSGSYRFTFAEESDESYLDWFVRDSVGVNYSSYFAGGYSVHGDAQRKFQPNYIYLFNETNNEANSLDFRSQWNFASSGDTGKWSSTQRIEFPQDDYVYQYRRIKTRGHGLALQYRIDSVAGEPFRLIGWSTFETQNQQI